MIHPKRKVTWFNWKRHLVSYDDVAVFFGTGVFIGFVAGFVSALVWF